MTICRSLADVDAVLFDLDGTLWDSVVGVSAAWQRALVRFDPSLRPPITDDEIRSCIGSRIEKIALKLFPMLDEKQRTELIAMCQREEQQHLYEVGGMLYPQVEETLDYLSAKYPLAILSNCQDGYIENFLALTGLAAYFSDFECPGRTGLDKAENIRLVCRRNDWHCPCLVGDMILDLISARETDIPFIYARYGFGVLDDFDFVIDSFAELRKLL